MHLKKIEYAINRFAMEAKRQLDLLDKELATKPYIAGEDYTIADIAIWSWYGRLAQDKVWDRAWNFPRCEGIQAFASLDRENRQSPRCETWLGSRL